MSEPVLLGPQLCPTQRHSGTWGNRCRQVGAAVLSLTLNGLGVGGFQGEPSSEEPRGRAAQHPAPTPPPATSWASGSPHLPHQTVRAQRAVGWLHGCTLPSLHVGMDFVAGVRGLERGLLLTTPAAKSPLQPELHLLQPVLPAGRSSWAPRLRHTAPREGQMWETQAGRACSDGVSRACSDGVSMAVSASEVGPQLQEKPACTSTTLHSRVHPPRGWGTFCALPGPAPQADWRPAEA